MLINMKNELKLGNYLHDAQGRLCKVELLKEIPDYTCDECFRAPAIKGAITTLPHKPIMITDDCLLKLGLIRNDNLSAAEASFEFPFKSGLFFLTKHTTAVNKTVYYDLAFPGSHGSVYKPKQCQFQYIHEIQNLVYIIFKEKLIFNNL